jgi:hypothetical protein
MPTLTQTATNPNPLAVIANVQYNNTLVSTLTSPLYSATAYLAHLLLRDMIPNAHAKAKEPNAFAPE